ncbi:hypothetical protein NSA19_02890 [Actinomyces bowdenii]|uniref:hypothetical protein n=1 Tax=Actinomyces bowdenii TaxID=131109 RepID=UPI00214BAA31|nr:hypothetical protein [Actinomyces bowdenii]MCR2051815.1 hypothetical protein [Actinomyces bowdenii]
MSDAPEIVTAADVAAASGGKVAQADPRLPALIKGATDGIRLLCGWHIAPVVEETLILDGNGGAVMQLPSLQVLKVTGVKALGEPIEVDWSADGMIEARRGRFPARFRSVEVTLQHGYATAPAVAAVITQAVLGAAASPMGATREQAGQVAVSWARTGLALNLDDMGLIRPYMIQSWA